MQYNSHFSPQFACEFQALHNRFDKLEALLYNLISSAPLGAPKAPVQLTNPTMSPWSEPFIPMNAKRAIPIINPLPVSEETEQEVKEKPPVTEITPESVARPLPSKELDPPLAPSQAALPLKTAILCLHCSLPLTMDFRVSNNKQDPAKFCNKNCKNIFKLKQKDIWDPTLVTNLSLVSPFVPLLERSDEVQFIEGPAGTGKSKLALEICLLDKDLGVSYVTASWIAAFEFAKKLADASLLPYIPAASGKLTDIALRARAKEFPDFTNHRGPDCITILIASMTHTSHITSRKLPEVVKNKKSGCHHSKREWSISNTPLGKNLVTLGHSCPLPHTIIVDEAGTVVDSVLQTLTFGVKKVVLLGDRFQRKPIADKETTDVLKPFQITPINTNSFREVSSDRVTTLTEGHRCPRDTYTLISAIYGYNVRGIETPLKTLPACVSDVVACPTIASTHKGEYTIDELQGQTCEGLIIRTRSQRDIDFLRMHPESVLVALSRHTSRFSWIDSSRLPDRSSERVFTITEFFSRFCKKQVPHDHPDSNLVSVRLIAKSVRPNSRLLTHSPKPSTPRPPSDRFANSIGERKSSAHDYNGARVEVTESLSSRVAASTTSSGGSQPTCSTLNNITTIPPRPTTVVENLLPKHSSGYGDSPKEVPLLSGDHVMRASATVNTLPGRKSTELEVKTSKLDSSIYIGKKLDMPIGETAESSNKKHIESDPVAHSSVTDLSSISDSSDSKITPPRRCLAPGCNYSGVAFMSNGMCVKHKEFVPPSPTPPQVSFASSDARTSCGHCLELAFTSPPLLLCDKCLKSRGKLITGLCANLSKLTRGFVFSSLDQFPDLKHSLDCLVAGDVQSLISDNLLPEHITLLPDYWDSSKIGKENCFIPQKKKKEVSPTTTTSTATQEAASPSDQVQKWMKEADEADSLSVTSKSSKKKKKKN